MGVYIKGMEMPKNCHKCPLLYVTSISCAYLNPKQNHCGRYLRGAVTAAYLCPFCRVNENEEMSKVSEMEMAYEEAQND